MNLAELISYIKEKEGLTWEQMRQRAIDAGYPDPTGLHNLGNPSRTPAAMPEVTTMYAVAAALNVNPHRVGAAALTSLGMEMVADTNSHENYDDRGQLSERVLVFRVPSDKNESQR